jgi:recombination protein RecT
MSEIKLFFDREDVKTKFKEMLGQKSTSFITSVLQIIASNSLLQKADPMSVYQAAAVAATLDLPLNNNLGFAYIVPYNDKVKGQVAQFQMGYKGFIQLAQRSGQFKSIYSAPIYEGQILEANPLDGYKFDFSKKTNDVVVGYAAKFTLINGFEAIYYMSIDQLKRHGNQYSQTFKKGFGLWKDNFDAMATKTVLKLLLSKYAPLSVDMQKSLVIDQSVVNDFEAIDVTYVDNEESVVVVDKEAERLEILIKDCQTKEELLPLKKHIKPEQQSMYWDKWNELNAKEVHSSENTLDLNSDYYAQPKKENISKKKKESQ